MRNLKTPVAFTVFLLLVPLGSTDPVLSFTFAELHQAAALPCYQSCSGSVTWAHKDEVLARCDQESCQAKDGFQISLDQYRRGTLSLTITAADYSKRKWYTCRCNGEAICDVSLRIHPFSDRVDVQAGDSLSLDLLISDDLEVTFNRTGDGRSATFRLCTIEGRKVQCESQYENRVSVGASLQAKEVKNQDDGVYIIRDIKNDEVIGMYTVTVNGQGVSLATLVPVVLLLVAILVIAVLLVKYYQLWKCRRHLENQLQISMRRLEEAEGQNQVEHQPEVPVSTPVMETGGIIEQKKLQGDPENQVDTSGVESDPLLEVVSPVSPASVTDEPPLSYPVPEFCSSNTQSRVF